MQWEHCDEHMRSCRTIKLICAVYRTVSYNDNTDVSRPLCWVWLTALNAVPCPSLGTSRSLSRILVLLLEGILRGTMLTKNPEYRPRLIEAVLARAGKSETRNPWATCTFIYLFAFPIQSVSSKSRAPRVATPRFLGPVSPLVPLIARALFAAAKRWPGFFDEPAMLVRVPSSVSESASSYVSVSSPNASELVLDRFGACTPKRSVIEVSEVKGQVAVYDGY